jgi:hypothetical protein
MAFTAMSLVALSSTVAWAAAGDASSPEITGSIGSAEVNAAEPAYEQREFIVKPGSEAIELAARLHENGGLISLPVSWRLHRLIGNAAGGEAMFQSEAPQTRVLLPPGDYRIAIEYGFARFSRLVTLDPGRRLFLVFNLNTGAVRILSRIVLEPPVPGFTTAHRVFALSGPNRARLVAENARSGDLLRLPAGLYRIESELRPGNAVAEAEVAVKPGVLSAVEIDHQAGMVRLTLPQHRLGSYAWQIKDADGTLAAEAHGPFIDAVLLPGRYQVRAAADGVLLTGEFHVSAGNSFHYVLGQ